MFAPENDCIEYLRSKNIIDNYQIEEPLGIHVSSSDDRGTTEPNNLISESVKNFLERFENLKVNKKAKYAIKQYYIPFFTKYFFGIERIIKNISKMASKDFEGYFIVANNTARNLIVPVAENIMEVFSYLDFNAETQEELKRELSHFGDINPVVKGFKARHMEYTIKIWRS